MRTNTQYSTGYGQRGTRQAMRPHVSTLQAFIPLNTPAWDNDVLGFSELLPEAVPAYPMRDRNVGEVGVFLEGRKIGKLSSGLFTLTKVAAADELRLVRPGKPEYVEQFPTDGLLLHVRLPVALSLVARQLTALPHAGVSLGFKDLSGRWGISNRLGAGFRERCYRVNRAKLTGLYIVAENGDPGTSVTMID